MVTALHAQGLSALGCGTTERSRHTLHSAGMHPSREVPPQKPGGALQDHCETTQLPPFPDRQNTSAHPAELRDGASQLLPSPSSSDTSRISSTVSGKLMRCLSPTDCREQSGVRDQRLRHTPLAPSSQPGAHQDICFLRDDLEHVCDRDVAQALCDGQRSGAVLCREGRWVSSSGHRGWPWGQEMWVNVVLTVLISLGEAPCFSSSVTTSVWPCCAAWCRGV